MLVLLDTNVLIYSVDALSPWHQETTTAVSRLRQRGEKPGIVSQTSTSSGPWPHARLVRAA